MYWDVPVELSEQEKEVAGHLERIGKFFVFLRKIRHRLFDDDFQKELQEMYDKPRGNDPKPPAMLAMVTLLQAYDDRGDADAVITASLDRRWQLVLGTLDDGMEAPFSQGALPKFRQRMAEHDFDVKLLNRTVEVARETGLFGWRKLKGTLDASPLIGAGRVEDEFNLIGRAMKQLAQHLGEQTEGYETVVDELGLTVLESSSFKAAFDIQWSHTKQRNEALNKLVEQARRLVEHAEQWIDEHSDDEEAVARLELLETILDQNLEPDPDGPGKVRIRQGVASDRITSISDPQMRHGRKSDSHTYTGYQRHILRGVDVPLILSAVAQPANRKEAEATGELLESADESYEAMLFDRGYLSSDKLVELGINDDVELLSKPWSMPNSGRFTKDDFEIDVDEKTVTCPADHTTSFSEQGKTVFFGEHCQDCPLREDCTTASPPRGRSISIHENEALMQRLRKLVETTEGRRRLRQRACVEHGLARIKQLQGPRARYWGTRKNSLDLRRHATVANLQALAHRYEDTDEDVLAA